MDKAVDWLSQLVVHIPGRYEHTVRYYGYYSNWVFGTPTTMICRPAIFHRQPMIMISPTMTLIRKFRPLIIGFSNDCFPPCWAASRTACKLWQNTLFGGHKYWDALSKEPSASNLNSSIRLIL
jgi:hypothetical protein